MDMDCTKPDTSTPVPVHNVSSSMSTSAPSTIDASPSTVSQSKTSENLVVSGPSKRTPGPAVAPQTDLDNMDTSDTKPNENQEVPTFMDSNDDALLRLLLLSMLNNPNMDMNSSKPGEDFVSSGPSKRTPDVAPSTSKAQVPSSMGAKASNENFFRLPNTSPSPRPPWEVDDQVKSKLCNVLCGQELEKGIMSHYIAEFPVIFWAICLKFKLDSVWDIIRHIEGLVALLDESDGNPTLNSFYEVGRGLEGWPKSSTLDNHLEYANDIFWLSINHPSGMPRPDRLKNISNQLFGKRLGGYNSRFSVTIKQIKNADITIMSTSQINEHFLYKDGVLFLLGLDENHTTSLYGLQWNVIARKVGIESLGREILASYHSLLSEDPTWEEAVKIGLLKCKTDEDRAMVSALISVENREFPRPFLLARRERDLIKEIERRKKWWRMLSRDIRRQYNTQPFLFYGSVLALLFGVCQIIQTVESLQALFAPQSPQCGCPGA